MLLTCAHCDIEFSARRYRITCSRECKNARARSLAEKNLITRKCSGCQKEFTQLTTQARATCSRECHLVVLSLARGGKGINRDITDCKVCGKLFPTTYWYKKRTCSKECYTKLRRSIATPLPACEVCGKQCTTKVNKTCSRVCAAELRAIKARSRVSKERNLCIYTPPNEHDRENMIEILTRKGYTQGQASIPYQWEEAEGSIKFKDLPPRDLSPEDAAHNREARARKELKAHRHGVEQASQKKGAHKSPLEKLLSSIEGGAA